MDISNKIKLYCTLYGHNALALDDESLKSNNCINCREKNEGICNIRYGNNRQIIFDGKTGKIIAMSGGTELGGYLVKEYLDESWAKFKVDGVIYDTHKTKFCWFCFGFLNENK